MKYLEIIFRTTSFSEIQTEILIARLSVFGFDSFEEKPNELSAFILQKKFSTSAFKNQFSDIKYFNKLKVNKLEEKNWNEIWESSFKPVFFGTKCCIRAPFHNACLACQYDIIIAPKMSFGTGHHATTFLIMSQLLSHNLSGKKILDVGTGTGVLSILAEKMGGEEISAIDIETMSYINSLENIKLNHCKNISVFQTNIFGLSKNQSFDFVLANINKNVILKEISQYDSFLSDNGHLILSGFLKSDFNAINNLALSFNLRLSLKEVKKEWMCLVYVK